MLEGQADVLQIRRWMCRRVDIEHHVMVLADLQAKFYMLFRGLSRTAYFCRLHRRIGGQFLAGIIRVDPI